VTHWKPSESAYIVNISFIIMACSRSMTELLALALFVVSSTGNRDGPFLSKIERESSDESLNLLQINAKESWVETVKNDEAVDRDDNFGSGGDQKHHGHRRHSRPHRPSADDRPNILFLMTDSMDGRILDSDNRESTVAWMPFLQGQLAPNGTNFVHAYSNNPVCVPSRSSMMTGRSSEKIQVWGNNRGIAMSPHGVLDSLCVETYGKDNCLRWADAQGHPMDIMHKFKDLGYNVRAEGTSDAGAAHANEEQCDAKKADCVPGKLYNIAFTNPTGGDFFRISGIKTREANKTAFEEAKVTTEPEDFGSWDKMPRDACLDWIRNDLPAPEDNDKPFFLYCSFRLPHYPYTVPQKFFNAVQESKIFLPTWLEGFPDKWHPYDVYKSLQDGIDGDFDEKAIVRLRRIFYAMCLEADENLAMIWRALFDEKGYSLENTYVLHVSDHGELAFDHRQMMKSSLYEGSVRVPIMLAGPGIKKGARLEHLVSLLDVFPTLLDMAGVSDATQYSDLQGSSLLLAAGGDSIAPVDKSLGKNDTRDFVWSQYNWCKVASGSYMARSGDWKLITFGHLYNFTKLYPPQLFNVKLDPQELKNVADENPMVVEELKTKLKEKAFDHEEVELAAARTAFEHMKISIQDQTHSPDFLDQGRAYQLAGGTFTNLNKWDGWHLEDGSFEKFKLWLEEAKLLLGETAS